MPANSATPSLATQLTERIRRDGPLRFSAFMAAALYDPQLGYYARQTRQVGRRGDFFTSVSVGPLFGQILARRFLRHWRDSGRPDRWRIIECGAHDGSLARDILGTLEALDPAAYAALDYIIPEPLPHLQAAQRQLLRDHPVDWTNDLAELAALKPLPGVAFGNELLDALPCDLVEWQNGAWHECRVAAAGDPPGDFTWKIHPIDDDTLARALLAIPGPYRPGYRTEVRSGFGEILAPLARALTRGLMVWIDYGFARCDYYHPDRQDGTLRTYSQHRAGDAPLADPGNLDITAHVDFTAVAEAAIELGGHAISFRPQGSWLTATAHEWLLELEQQLEQQSSLPTTLLRQLQTLIHPAHLGAHFHVLELSWDPAHPPVDPTQLAHHLFGNFPE